MQDEDGVIIDNFAIWNVFVENIKRVCYNLFYPSDDIVSIYKGELMRLNSDADFVWDITPEEDERKLFNTRMRLAEKNGKEQGIKLGIEQNNLDNARKMKEKGFNIKDIQDITGLSKEEIQKL